MIFSQFVRRHLCVLCIVSRNLWLSVLSRLLIFILVINMNFSNQFSILFFIHWNNIDFSTICRNRNIYINQNSVRFIKVSKNWIFHQVGNRKTLWTKIKLVGVPQSENCIPLTDSSPLMGEKCPFIGSIGPFSENSIR